MRMSEREAVIAPSAWCGASLPPGDRGRPGGCGTCGVATTLPWPSASELAEGYRGW